MILNWVFDKLYLYLIVKEILILFFYYKCSYNSYFINSIILNLVLKYK